MMRMLGQNPTKEELDAIIEEVDEDGEQLPWGWRVAGARSLTHITVPPRRQRHHRL